MNWLALVSGVVGFFIGYLIADIRGMNRMSNFMLRIDKIVQEKEDGKDNMR